MKKKMEINLNLTKNIGQVIYIVEGESKEFRILQHIFTEVLDFTYIPVTRGHKVFESYKSKTNPNSKIFVINAENSNLASIKTGKAYLDNMFKDLVLQYGFDLQRAAIYYIFDRDPCSNPSAVVDELMRSLKNSRDNEDEMNGLLLLSYPCIEAYLFESFMDDCFSAIVINAKQAKSQSSRNGYEINRIKKNNIQHAAYEMLNTTAKLSLGIRIEDLDNFAEKNLEIFCKQEEIVQNGNSYKILSLLSLSFFDLGILELIQ